MFVYQMLMLNDCQFNYLCWYQSNYSIFKKLFVHIQHHDRNFPFLSSASNRIPGYKDLNRMICIIFSNKQFVCILFRFECSNPIYGTTVNPHNSSRGPGGSSGGEGAILGAGASILGWGTDIGGSVRIPSHFCGVYCLKPTSGRLR